MRKLCIAAITMLIAAGCGDAESPAPDSDTASADKPGAASTEKAESESSDEKSKIEVASAKDDEESSPVAAGLAAIKEESTEKMAAFRKWYSSASDEDKQNDFQKYYPDNEAYAARAMKLATDSPEDPAAADALVTAATMSRGETAKEARTVLFEKHKNHEALAKVIPMMGYDTGAETEKGLRTILKETTNDRVKAFATLTLGQYLSRANQTKQMIAENEDAKKYYAEEVGYLESFELDQDEVESLFATVVEKYGSVSGSRGTLGESAAAALFELKNLQVGMPVPDIEGADLDGVDFKLSDYKGKVVLLDFWGNW